MGLAESVDPHVAGFHDSDDHAYISFFTDMALNNFTGGVISESNGVAMSITWDSGDHYH
jgi:hypothetical protein